MCFPSMEQTLSEYLTRDDPPIRFNPQAAKKKFEKSGGRGSTKNDQWPKVESVHKWEEFSRQNLEKCFGGKMMEALQTKHVGLADFSGLHPSFCSLESEPCLRALITKYHHSVVLEALSKTSGPMLRQDVVMATGSAAVLVYDGIHQSQPDYAGITCATGSTCDLELKKNILPGDVKPSWKWTSKALPEGKSLERQKEELEKNRGLSQVVNYCIKASVRYGYMLTNEELCIFRIRHNDTCRTKPTNDAELRAVISDKPAVDYASVSWSYGQESHEPKLTISLALWALHLLAANDGSLQFEEYGALEDEVLIASDEQSISFQAPSAHPSDYPEAPPEDPGEDDEEGEEAEDEEGEDQDLSTFSPNASFHITGRQEPSLTRVQKRKRGGSKEPEDDEIVVSSRRGNLRPRTAAGRAALGK